MKPFSLRGKVALVTGSSRGLGAEIARTLASQGASVVINGVSNQENAQCVTDEIRKQGGVACMVMADVSTEKGCVTLLEQAVSQLGDVDILVVNATPFQPVEKLEDYSLADYESMLAAFAHSPFLLAKQVLPKMKEKGWGRIINITSEVIENGITNYSAYVTAKGAQNSWTHCMARELAPFGITVNNVAPGWIPVERHEDGDAESMNAYLARVPAGRWGTPKDVANAVLYFASEEAGFVNGQKLSVNGANTVG